MATIIRGTGTIHTQDMMTYSVVCHICKDFKFLNRRRKERKRQTAET